MSVMPISLDFEAVLQIIEANPVGNALRVTINSASYSPVLLVTFTGSEKTSRTAELFLLQNITRALTPLHRI